MNELLSSVSRYSPHALALLRIVTGALFLEHGLIKLFGFPPGLPPGVKPLLTQLGAAGAIEVVTGALVILGLLTRPAAFIAAGEMAIAYWQVHAPRGFYPAGNGGEGAILFCFIFFYIFFAGAGAFSIDGDSSKKSA